MHCRVMLKSFRFLLQRFHPDFLAYKLIKERKTMNIPGFTAEATLYRTSSRSYLTSRQLSGSGIIYPAQLITQKDIWKSCVSCESIVYKDDYGNDCFGKRCTNWCISPPLVVSNEIRCFPVPIPVPKFPPKPETDPSLPFPRF